MGEGGVGGDSEAESKLLICSTCIYSTISLHLLHFQPQLMPFPPYKALFSFNHSPLLKSHILNH